MLVPSQANIISKYLSTVIIEEWEKNLTLQDGLFDAINNGFDSIYIPTNTSLSNNAFAEMNIKKI